MRCQPVFCGTWFLAGHARLLPAHAPDVAVQYETLIFLKVDVDEVEVGLTLP